MTLSDKLNQIKTIFIDTAPIIYFIEAHPKFGPLTMEIVETFQTRKINAFSSVLTLTEVLSKPMETGDDKLAKRFSDFLKHGKNLKLIEVSMHSLKWPGNCVDNIQVSELLMLFNYLWLLILGLMRFLPMMRNLNRYKK